MNDQGFEITIKGKNYKTKSFPTMGNFYDVETMKSLLSSGTYHNIATSTTKNALEATTMIAMEAYFSIFFPELIKDLKIPIRDLSLKDYMELKKVYTSQFIPQLNEWTKVFSDINDDEE